MEGEICFADVDRKGFIYFISDGDLWFVAGIGKKYINSSLLGVKQPA